MTLTDTHTHVYLPEFDSDREAVMQRALEAGVDKMILPAVDESSLGPMKAMKDQWPDRVFLAAGLHPTDLGNNPMGALDGIEAELATGQYVAVGEIGMDLYWDRSRIDEQMQVFDRQMRFAAAHNLPVIIHCREALEATLEVIEGLPCQPRGVFHSFSGTASEVDRIRNYGDYYFGLNGVATFKKCHVTDAVPEITPERLLLETDAPYLAPVPNRGKRNEPAFVAYTCKHIAISQGIAPEYLASVTTGNAKNLFGI